MGYVVAITGVLINLFAIYYGANIMNGDISDQQVHCVLTLMSGMCVFTGWIIVRINDLEKKLNSLKED